MMLVIIGKSSELFLMLRNVKYFFWGEEYFCFFILIL